MNIDCFFEEQHEVISSGTLIYPETCLYVYLLLFKKTETRQVKTPGVDVLLKHIST